MVERLRSVLMAYVSSISAESVLRAALRRTQRSDVDLERGGLDQAFIAEILRGLEFFLESEADRRTCRAKLEALAAARGRSLPPGSTEIETEIAIDDEAAIVDARTRARAIARELGFDRADQAKIATSVSELARNIYAYARPGRVLLSALTAPRLGIRIVATDEGPGIPNLDEILAGSYRSKSGMGLGILACKRLMDDFAIDSVPGRGTTVSLEKFLP